MQIKLESVSHVYLSSTPQETTALKNINLTIQENKVIGIIGHTGSGKSTLIQTLNGLITPTSGKVWVDNQDITNKKANLSKIRQQIGLIFQYAEHQLFEDTVFNDVAFGPKNQNLSEEEIRQRVHTSLAQVDLDVNKIGHLSPMTLSGGEKRRVAIAGVLAMEPKVLILDEPTAALDPKSRVNLLNLLKSLKEKHGITVVIVSHSMDQIATIADELVVMEQGSIIIQGTPKEVFQSNMDLNQLGLGLPGITLLMKELNARGMSVATDIFTVTEAVEQIIKARGRAGV